MISKSNHINQIKNVRHILDEILLEASIKNFRCVEILLDHIKYTRKGLYDAFKYAQKNHIFNSAKIIWDHCHPHSILTKYQFYHYYNIDF